MAKTWADVVKESAIPGGAKESAIPGGAKESAKPGGAINIVVLPFNMLYRQPPFQISSRVSHEEEFMTDDDLNDKPNEIMYFDEYGEIDPDVDGLLVSDKKTFRKAEIKIEWITINREDGTIVRCCDRDLDSVVEKAELLYEYQNKKNELVTLRYACIIDFINKKISVAKK
jgi:hypothetical protein